VRKAIERIKAGVRAEKAGPADLANNGNGALMRILPVPIWAANTDQFGFVDAVTRVAHVTHGHELSTAACVFYAIYVRNLLVHELEPIYAYQSTIRQFEDYLYVNNMPPKLRQEFRPLVSGHLHHYASHQIYSGGYVRDTLMAALWCFLTTKTYRQCVLKAVNLGADTDTTACVAGGLAGLYYGIDEIPEEWLFAMPRLQEVDQLISDFCMALEKQWETGV